MAHRVKILSRWRMEIKEWKVQNGKGMHQMFIMDVDGTPTDGKIISARGEEFKPLMSKTDWV